MKIKLFLLSFFFIIGFTLFSYSVAKERWQQTDFNITVKLQDHIPRKYDQIFSYFSLLGSAEVTVGICIVLAFKALLKLRWKEILGWSLIVSATLGEIFGKLVLFHPAPPQFFHRSLLPTSLPSFYVHTDFSYPSGHMTRTIFIIVVLVNMMFFSSKDFLSKVTVICLLIALAFLMGLTRIYLGEHWLSDVLGGFMLGVGMGFLASVLILRKDKDNIAATALRR